MVGHLDTLCLKTNQEIHVLWPVNNDRHTLVFENITGIILLTSKWTLSVLLQTMKNIIIMNIIVIMKNIIMILKENI